MLPAAFSAELEDSKALSPLWPLAVGNGEAEGFLPGGVVTGPAFEAEFRRSFFLWPGASMARFGVRRHDSGPRRIILRVELLAYEGMGTSGIYGELDSNWPRGGNPARERL